MEPLLALGERGSSLTVVLINTAVSLKQEIEVLGAGVFVRSKNVESRLEETDFHRAFSEPVTVWIMPGEYREERIECILTFSRRLHEVRCFRFPGVAVSPAILARIQVEFPAATIEGAK